MLGFVFWTIIGLLLLWIFFMCLTSVKNKDNEDAEQEAFINDYNKNNNTY